jgi:dipeptidyl aminopeptidase/acylaminoacyl peptidase
MPLLILLSLSLALVLPVPAAAQPPGVVQEQAGEIGGIPVHAWTYPSDGLQVNGLLFLPRGTKPLPLVLFNHDGVSGISKEHMRASARLARSGYAVFAPSYRGEDGSQGTVEVAAGEVRDVLNVLPFLAQVPGIDARRVALLGVSHGALISVLAAAQLPRVSAVVEADGVMDIYGWWSYLKNTGTLARDDLTRRVYGDGPHDKPQAFAARDALARIPKLKAPVLMLHGGKDDVVPAGQAARFKLELEKAGVPVTLKIYPNCPHAFLVYLRYPGRGVEPVQRAETAQAWRDLLAFLKRHLQF